MYLQVLAVLSLAPSSPHLPIADDVFFLYTLRLSPFHLDLLIVVPYAVIPSLLPCQAPRPLLTQLLGVSALSSSPMTFSKKKKKIIPNIYH